MSKKQPTKSSEPEVKRRYRVQFDITYSGNPGVTLDGTSMTVPDLNLTVRQLLEHHTRGHDGLIHQREPLYLDTPIPTIHDITDVARYREQLKERLDEANKFIKNELDQKAKEKEQAVRAKRDAESGAEAQPESSDSGKSKPKD